MSLIQQSLVQSLLNECDELVEKQQREAKEAVVKKIDQIYELFRRNIRDAFTQYSLDVIVRFCEISVEIAQRFDKAAEIVQLFFERISNINQFYIRGLLVKAKVVAYTAHSNNEKGQEMLGSLRQSISFISKALDFISPQQEVAGKGKDAKGAPSLDANSNKSKYAFLIYNASVTVYKVTRFLLRPGWQKFFVEVYQRIYKLLQEVDEADHNWRSRFSMIYYQCLYDSERKPDAYKVLDTLWEKTKNKPCQFQDSLFRLRVFLCKQNNALAANIKKDVEGTDPNGWKVLEALHRMRTGLVPEAQVEKQLMTIVNQISLGVLSTSQNSNSTQLSPIMQERLAEAGRIALRFNLTNLASSIITFLGKTRQPSQKALVLNEYNKAELLIKKKGDYVDKKTGMSMNALQIKSMQIQNRKQALKIMEKVMIINKKLDNAQLIYEGAILVWNIALPFLSEQYHGFAAKALDLSLSLLEQTDSNDHDLRTKFHLSLINIYFDNDLMFAEVQSNVFKSLKLDPSIPTNKLINRPEPQEEHSLYSRPYHRYLYDFRQKVLLKNMQIPYPSPLDIVTQDLWTIYDHKSETTKIDTLQKCLKTLISYQQPPFKVQPEQLLVQQQIKKKKLEYDREKLRLYKRRKILASQIARLSFEWDLNDFAKKACEFVLSDVWDVKNSIELIISQGHCCLYLTQIKIDELYQENLQPLFQQQGSQDITEARAKQIKDKKAEVLINLKKNLEYATISQQNYLIFNGAICLWNNFLHIFRVTTNDSKLRADLLPLLKDYFQSMRNSLKQIETKNIVYYDLDDKIQVFSNTGLIYARLLQSQKQTALVEKVCQELLLTNLSPNTRKLINGIKARVAGGKAAGGKPADPKKGAPPPQKAPGFNDTFILDISNQLQLIQNSPNKNDCQNQIIKCFEGLQSWKPNQQDQSELELHAELWVKLARLASNEQNPKMLKYALRCAEKALAQSKIGEVSTIPSNRLRWYSLAQFLSSQSLLKLVNPKTQEASSVQGLLFFALGRGVEAATKGFKCGINVLVLDAGKQVWNVCAKLQESKSNRSKLIEPIRVVLNYLKDLKEDSEPDLLLLMSHLYFKATWENNQYKQGEEIADMMLDFLPKTLQKSIWEAKMAFMSKQGKNELQAISSIKQAEPSLQAKLWVKLARIAPNPAKQHAAYNKALEILKKEHSIEIVEVLIEYSEWQLRVNKESVDTVVRNLEYASNMLIEIQMDPQNYEEQENGEPEGMSVNSHSKSRSLKSKKSFASKSMKSSQKDIKSKAQKKPTVSNRSKASGISRMNRSGRAAKSIKNKNTKSVFSQREEDPNPQSLNCLHFQRLFRIYTILSMIHSNKNKKITFALKALKYGTRTIQKSIKTFNELQENAAKLNEKDEKLSYKTIKIPDSLEEWITYELPKQYIEKISKVQNMNFLGTYTLQKPELTYSYICKLGDILSQVGLDYQTVPLRFLSKYITKYILKNDDYYLLQELKLKKIFMINRHPLESFIKIQFQSIKITEQAAKQQQLKAQYQKINLSQNANSFDVVSPPNLIQPLSKYTCWFQLGRILIDFGQISLAKTHLKQSLSCAKILSNSELIGKIHSYLSQIAYLEGEVQQAVQHLLLAHRLCKSTSNWQKIIILAQKNLIAIKKYDILKNLLSKIQLTVSELIQESTKQGKERNTFKTEVNQLKQLLIAANLSMVYLHYRQILEQNTKENQTSYTQSLSQLQKNFQDKNMIWNSENLQHFLNNFRQIIQMYENRGGNQLINLGNDNLKIILIITTHLQKNIKDFIKSVNLNEAEGGNYNNINQIQIKISFLLVSCLSLNYKHSVIENSIDEMEVGSEGGNEKVDLLLKTLDRQIKLKSQPPTVKLNPLEQALTLLNDLEGHISENSIYYPRLLALFSSVQTLKDYNSSESFEANEQFRNKGEEKLQKYQNDPECHYYQLKAYEAMAQQNIENLPNQYFQSLAKAQHASTIISAFKFLAKKMNPNHRFASSYRLLQSLKNKELQLSLLQRQKLFSSLTKFGSFQEGLKLMPKNSVYIIIKLSTCKTKIFSACLINEPETNNKKILSKEKNLTFSDLSKFKNITELIVQCKKSLIKTPIDDENKLKSILQANEEKLKYVKAQLQTLNNWWLNDFLQFLKTPRNVPQTIISDKDKKGGAAKDPKKKGGKDQIGGYESPLPPSPSGIQSAVFLLDQFLYSLPYEELIPTDLLPAVSKDSSFFWVSRKLQQIGFQSEINNSSGFGADKGKYFGYDFKTPEKNFKSFASQLSKGAEGLKFQGIDTTIRLPALGDYSRVMLEPGHISIYGNIDILNHIKFTSFMQLAGANKFKLLVIQDNLNLYKSILNKFKDLNNDSLGINIEESEKAFAIISNLLNITLVKNRWFNQWPQLEASIQSIYKSLASGVYIGAGIRQNRGNVESLGSQWQSYTHGPAVLRI